MTCWNARSGVKVTTFKLHVGRGTRISTAKLVAEDGSVLGLVYGETPEGVAADLLREAVEDVPEFIAREFAPSSEQAAEDGGEG